MAEARSLFNDSIKMRDPSQQKRKKARRSVNVPAECQIVGHSDFMPCTLTDVGAGGLSLVTRSSLYVGDKVNVRFKMGETNFDSEGAVVRVLGKAVGIQFENLAETDLDRLQDFIHRAFKDRERKKP